MKVKHTKKLKSFRYLPDDKAEPELGAIVDVPDQLGVALVARGWGEAVKGKAESATPPAPESPPIRKLKKKED